jgi:hypothetical protein
MLSFKCFVNNYQNFKNDKQIAVKEKENLFKRLQESMAKHNKCVSELNSTKERMVCFYKLLFNFNLILSQINSMKSMRKRLKTFQL